MSIPNAMKGKFARVSSANVMTIAVMKTSLLFLWLMKLEFLVNVQSSVPMSNTKSLSIHLSYSESSFVSYS